MHPETQENKRVNGDIISHQQTQSISAEEGDAKSAAPSERSNTTGKQNLVQKLCSVMAAVERVAKNGRNEFHKYDYAREADIVEAIRGELAKRNLFIFPSVRTHTRTGEITDIMVRWKFCDGDSGEIEECDIPGSGHDRSDKGVYKALTGSEKYFLMKAFLIPTGDDPEKDEAGSKEAAKAVGEQKVKEMQAAKVAAALKNRAIEPDLEKQLKQSIEQVKSKPNLTEMLEAARNDGLFDELSGTIQNVRNMKTSPAKGNRPYRRISFTTMKDEELVDIEISAFDNFKMSDTTCFEALDAPDTIGGTALLVVERVDKYFNLKDIKQLGEREWDARLGVQKVKHGINDAEYPF